MHIAVQRGECSPCLRSSHHPPGGLPAGLEPGLLFAGEDQPLGLSVRHGKGLFPTRITTPQIRLAGDPVVDENKLFSQCVFEVAVIAVRSITVYSWRLATVAGMMVGHCKKRLS